MNLFEKICYRFREYPEIKIENVTFSYGRYFDGVNDHSFNVSGVWLEYCFHDENEKRYNQVSTVIYTVLRKMKNVKVETHHTIGYMLFRVIPLESYNQAMKEQEKADVFLNSFWQEIHRQNISGEKHDSKKATLYANSVLTDFLNAQVAV